MPDFVNHEVGSQFDIALHIAFYAYFDWRLWDVAALKAILSYELLLMIIYKNKIDASDKKGKKAFFPELIGYAHAANLINNKEFGTSKMFLKEMRNSFSHGYKGIAGNNNSLEIIRSCRDIIVNITTRYQSRQDNTNKHIIQENIGMSDTRSRAQDFFMKTVEPTVNEFLADKTNIRRGRLAAIVLSHMVDYWCVDHPQENKTKIWKDLASKTPIENDYSSSQAVWDACDASKHAVLDTKPHVLKDAQNVKQSMVGAYGTASYWEAPYGMPIPSDVVLTLNNGKRYSLSNAVSRVMDVWRQKLAE